MAGHGRLPIRPVLGTNVSLDNHAGACHAPVNSAARAYKGDWMIKRSPDRFFYRVFLPVSVAVNLALGVLILNGLEPRGWLGWLQVATGAFCCLVAGLLAAASWSKSYWGNAMARQVAIWRQIADAIFSWLEEAPLPADALQRLKRSLDEVVPLTIDPKDSAKTG
jgi:hypothetical protein